MPATPVGARAIVTIAARGGQRARQTVTSDPTTHTLYAQATCIALDDPVVYYAGNSGVTAVVG